MSFDTVIDAVALSNAANVVSSEIKNDHARQVDVEISWPQPAMMLGPSTFKLYILTAIDGTTFEDGSPTVEPEEDSEVHVFMVRNENIARRMVARNLSLPAAKYKYLVQSDSVQTATITLKEQKQKVPN